MFYRCTYTHRIGKPKNENSSLARLLHKITRSAKNAKRFVSRAVSSVLIGLISELKVRSDNFIKFLACIRHFRLGNEQGICRMKEENNDDRRCGVQESLVYVKVLKEPLPTRYALLRKPADLDTK